MTSPTVLIAEDNREFMSLLEESLNHDGFNVIAAVDGWDALDQLDTVQPDVMIVDLLMPQLDGYALCVTARGRSNHHDLPILLMTGLGDDPTVTKLLALPRVRMMAKPPDLRQLTVVLHELIASEKGPAISGD